MAHRVSFLSNVRHLHLLSDEKSGPFAIPNCPKLGINLLLDVHLYDYHIAFDPSLNDLGGGFWRFIGQQPDLTTIHVYHESQACLFSEEAHPEEVYITETLVIPPAPAVLPQERLHYDTDRIASLCGELAYSTGRTISKDKLTIKESLFYKCFIPKLETILIKVQTIRGHDRWGSSNLLQRLQAGVEMSREMLMGAHSFTPAPTIAIRWSQVQGSSEKRVMTAELVSVSREIRSWT